jgi:hypothetical protein
MKTTIKISLIVISVVIAVGAILHYIDTVMRPPQKIEPQNQFLDELTRRIDEIPQKGNTIDRSDYLYKKISHKIQLYHDMKYLTDVQRDEKLEVFMAEYIPVFLDQSFVLFRKSVWNEGDHTFIINRITEIKDIMIKKAGSSTPLVESTSSVSDQMLQISNIIDNYNEAKKLMSQTSFNGINPITNRIKRARELQGMEYLSNCTHIVNGLKELPPKIHESHYAFLARLDNQLHNFFRYSLNEYQERFSSIDTQVTEYENNATKLYGSKKDIESIKTKLVNSYLEGEDYLTWQSARDTNTIQSYNWYLKHFPDGRYSTLAKDAIKRLNNHAGYNSNSSQAQRYSNTHNNSQNRGYSNNYRFVTTTTSSIPLREKANVNSRAIYQCPQNATVYIIDNSGDVYFRVHVNGYNGYISKGYLNKQQ